MNIGIFDSGIGGLTLLTQAMIDMPNENYIFYADTDHVPYGTKTKEEIVCLVTDIIEFMIEHDCKAVVIACNTATSAAVKILREKYSLPIIGIEPAVKPAVENSNGKRVMVIATPLTIREDKLKNLVERVDDDHLVDMVACPKLVEFAEKREFDTAEVDEYLRDIFKDYDMSQYSEFVLGCTHFNYFKDSYSRVFPKNIGLIDGSKGTINHLRDVLEKNNLLSDGTTMGQVKYFYSGREVSSKEELDDLLMLRNRLDKMRDITTT